MADITLRQLLARRTDAAPDAVALLAPGREGLSYAGLLDRIDAVGAALRRSGLGCRARVAVALDEGPEAAVVTLGVAAAAIGAPINPAYRVEECRQYLTDLRAEAVIVSHREEPAARAAQTLGLPILVAETSPGAPAGVCELRGDAGRVPGTAPITPDDLALVLHTSGTTARPKIIPRTHRNVVVSAVNLAAGLDLTAADRCLDAMPLFHNVGLMAVLAPLAAGGSVVCPPALDPESFFDWLDETAPTWYTAVPTAHMAILESAEGYADVIARCRLRFIRSTSSALAPQTKLEIGRVLGAPVVETYGHSETGFATATSPAFRKPGSVGVAVGCEVAIVDESGRAVATGTLGEVCVRGPSVSTRYEGTPELNARTFRDGWFRTGDHGHLDRDGDLFLAGRLTEVINRGGEKISPREIDEVLLDHPSVAEVVAFGLPHPTLGEVVAAAVVVRPDCPEDAESLRRFASARLAAFKVPARFVFLEALPKTPMGKPVRIDLARRLGLA